MYVSAFPAPMSLHMCIPDVLRRKKRASGPLELEIQIVVNLHMVAILDLAL